LKNNIATFVVVLRWVTEGLHRIPRRRAPFTKETKLLNTLTEDFQRLLEHSKDDADARECLTKILLIAVDDEGDGVDGVTEAALQLALTALWEAPDEQKAESFLGHMALLAEYVLLGFELTTPTRAAFEEIYKATTAPEHRHLPCLTMAANEGGRP
jgi:hypothetical protein